MISCLAVVLLHANGVFWEFSYDRYWVTANIIEHVFIFAVPCFFMISGATLMDYRNRYSTAEFFKKRVLKTVIPYLFWSLFALLFFIALTPLSFGDYNVWTFLTTVLNHKSLFILWFLPAIFVIYLCIPVISLIPRQSREKVFLYIILTYFILNSLLPTLAKTVFKGSLEIQLTMPLGSEYLVYAIMGYFIDQYTVKPKYRLAVYVLGFAGLMTQILGTYMLSYSAGKIIDDFKGCSNFPCVLYSAAVFMLFRYFDFESLPLFIRKLTDFFSGAAFGVYLIHWISFELVKIYAVKYTYSIIYRIFGGIFVFLLSTVIVKLLQKIPVIKRLLP